MDTTKKVYFYGWLKKSDKVKPLAESLIRAAAEQGANIVEFQVAYELAREAYAKAMDNSSTALEAFVSEAETALDCITKDLASFGR